MSRGVYKSGSVDGNPLIYSPPFESAQRKSNRPSAIFSLVSTIVGGGALSLPFALAEIGLGLGVVLLVFSGIVSDFSLYLLVAASRRTGAVNYEQVAYYAFGFPAQLLTLILLLLLTYLSMVAYAVLIGDLLTSVVEFVVPLVAHQAANVEVWGRRCLMFIAMCVVSPFSFMQSLHALRYTSVLCIFSMVVLASCVVVRMVQKVEADTNTLHEIQYAPTNWSNVLYALPLFCVSFLCHFNVLSTHGELVQPSKNRISTVVHVTVAICTVIYLVIGVCGYLYAPRDTCGNIMQNFPDGDPFATIGRLMLCSTLMFSYPLLALPCRAVLHRLLVLAFVERCRPSPPDELDEPAELREPGLSPMDDVLDHSGNTPRTGDGGSDSDASDDSLGSPKRRRSSVSTVHVTVAGVSDNEAPQEQFCERLVRLSEILVLILSALALACAIPSVVKVWTIMGASISILIAFTLPSAFYLKVRWHKKWKTRKVLAAILFVFSVPLSVLSTYEAIKHLADPACGAQSG